MNGFANDSLEQSLLHEIQELDAPEQDESPLVSFRGVSGDVLSVLFGLLGGTAREDEVSADVEGSEFIGKPSAVSWRERNKPNTEMIKSNCMNDDFFWDFRHMYQIFFGIFLSSVFN